MLYFHELSCPSKIVNSICILIKHNFKFQFLVVFCYQFPLYLTKVIDLYDYRDFTYLEKHNGILEIHWKIILLKNTFMDALFDLLRTTVETGKGWQCYIQSFIQQRFVRYLLNIRHYFRHKSQQDRQKSLPSETSGYT